MDHPHNAVMLVCSSHEKGCRPFMCDTSYRHSNCLDQYRKASKESSKDSAGTAECIECQQPVKLACPLCRGPVSHWTKDYDARKFMNSKDRACTMESCEFKGSYNQLRKHAREDHPAIRPMEVDPDRQRDWHRMEQQRDLGDLFSMLRSGFSGREDGAGIVEAEEGAIERSLHGPSITMVFIVRSGRSFLHYTDGEVPGRRSRTILVLGEPIRGESSRTRGANSNGDAEATTTDNEEADDLGLSMEASAGSQQDVGEVDGDTAQ
ncbi:uncharacterized protein LOC100823577 isoform X2 [Brachypodium distachyon]|uniref:Uncharacterized protein n=2 Tax=Brachypodium distachyon TaxID=15368 RepID=A0A2K2DDP0_BRADI|nr:uncharacterized protein LOC100823577 isoform X2 [Brachypodium distachyon]PNT72379.1 hypothetical protein BRADI_2g43350v3 [Brachypodium distachyon]|eukprot:XP_014755064.1 uncharacterized protein LOC100823577 isoform X2 [Brachypodium distachyon]